MTKASPLLLGAALCLNLFVVGKLPAAPPRSLSEAVERMKPMEETPPPTGEVVDRTTLDGKVMAGYQGWFGAPGDGSGLGWRHYGRWGRIAPGQITIDFWPDMTEAGPEERFATPFRHSNGETASLFSSFVPKTVERHFRWMQEYGIDGVFLQRFAGSTVRPLDLHHRNGVTRNVQLGANRYGRTWAMMYDLSGSTNENVFRRVSQDWKNLVDRMKILEDPAYLHHKGKPVLAVWGVGFRGRNYGVSECRRLIEFLKNDPKYGGLTIMLGVPGRWLSDTEGTDDSQEIRELIGMADIVSPWTVGRYHTPGEASDFAEQHARTEIRWCRQQGQDYLPVIWPGFSWYNLQLLEKRVRDAKLDATPRLGGRFLWYQAVANRRAGARMLYVAMFDEVDEGTAIFKVTNDPPTGKSPFVTYEGLRPDHYLWLTGKIGEMIRGEISTRRPQREATATPQGEASRP